MLSVMCWSPATLQTQQPIWQSLRPNPVNPAIGDYWNTFFRSSGGLGSPSVILCRANTSNSKAPVLQIYYSTKMERLALLFLLFQRGSALIVIASLPGTAKTSMVYLLITVFASSRHLLTYCNSLWQLVTTSESLWTLLEAVGRRYLPSLKAPTAHESPVFPMPALGSSWRILTAPDSYWWLLTAQA